MKEKITVDEWIAVLNAAMKPTDSDGLTTREIGQRLGLAQNATRERLNRAISLGVWECCGAKIMQSISGQMIQVPCYRPVEKRKQ